MSRFNPEFYQYYRPFYPVEVFDGLAVNLAARGRVAPWVIGDIGCGMGHTTVSCLLAGIDAQILAVDPDPKMLEAASEIVSSEFQKKVSWSLGSGEVTGLPDYSVDAIIVGSAFHWMRPQDTAKEFRRILRSQGLVRIFEYQFPKALDLPELNEWIRRQFNLLWKAPDQKPRGTLKELTSVFSKENGFERIKESKPKMLVKLTADELTGHILSQSRVLHYENTLEHTAIASFRSALTQEIDRQMSAKHSVVFDFKLKCFEFFKESRGM
jgi:ubiquinone/menaquinone biosynthesis C-methylase UbiE